MISIFNSKKFKNDDDLHVDSSELKIRFDVGELS